ncbi:hypothetical protein [Succinimonas amylolytica]|uniref:hypothetical protein n=1 Tax=Succinimonas amylolytica TaxID=83769 RepID=UPI00036F15EF|nr:hypothetical protein [Succinimonas amylolytica]
MKFLKYALALMPLLFPWEAFSRNPGLDNDGWTMAFDGAEAFISHETLGEIRMESVFALSADRVPEYMKQISLLKGCSSGISEAGSEVTGCDEWELVEILKDSHYIGKGKWYRAFFYRPSRAGSLAKMRFVGKSIAGNDPVDPTVLGLHFPEWTLLRQDVDDMSYTYLHEDTGARVIFEKGGFYFDGDTAEIVVERLKNRYQCGNPVKTEIRTSGKKPEHPYSGGVKMFCPDHTAIYVFKNGGTVIYDFVIKALTPEAEKAGLNFILKTEELNPLM